MNCSHKDYVILKQRGRQITAQCSDCKEIFTIIKEKPIFVPIIINRHDKSEKKKISLEKGRKIVLMELLDVDGEDVEIHAIELKDRRVDKAEVKDIVWLWGVSISFPHIMAVSVHHPHKTVSYKVKVERGKYYGIGDILQIGNVTFEVNNIMSETGKRKKAEASEIKRLYGKPVKRIAYEILEVYDGTG